MRLATWNCYRGDATKRAAALDDLAPDVLVLQECARPKAPVEGVTWLGGKPHHGVAAVARSGFEVLPVDGAPSDDSAYPCRVEGARTFNLLAVWAKSRPTYVASLWGCLDCHRDWLRDGATVIAGDFNSHTRWDGKGRPNHTDLVSRLRDEFGLVSAWHAVNAMQGREEPATLFHLRKPELPYHIDYIFIPESWVASVTACWVPDDPAGARRSDHRPVVVDLSTPD